MEVAAIEYYPVDFQNLTLRMGRNLIALTGSVYFTVAIAIDRYIAVWWPLQSRILDLLPDRNANGSGNALSWSYVPIMMVFPLTLLVVFNTLIYVKVHQANKVRKLMTSQEKTETLFTVICVMVVTLFVTCNSAVVVSAFVKYFYNCNYQLWKPVLDTIDNLLVSINSSCNFIIYCAVGSRFRRQLRALLCRHKSVAVDDTDSTTEQINDRKQAAITC
ncbi:unnamed protein product [Allacma fusca]|uniref:G-protein coupled receptors family 1 profile domain-containing protein n=1 Tax=Allacma fusca TaxID=39272 RepID=A0A8J2PP72_9HEXA|nr:unnamed protein product [Allacma fusca]